MIQQSLLHPNFPPFKSIDKNNRVSFNYAVSELGDVWLLGRHKLLCGDALNEESVDGLMAGGRPDMIYADPSYGVDYKPKGGHTPRADRPNPTKRHGFAGLKNDSTSDTAKNGFKLYFRKYPEAMQIWWGANYYPGCFPDGFGWLAWDKQRSPDFNLSQIELAFCNKGKRARIFTHQWDGFHKESERENERLHPTQKPLVLAEFCFENYGNPQLVLDPFGGSGTTLIACEITKRVCRMIELDMNYCDVIVRRFQDWCGVEAIHESSGKTYWQLLEERIVNAKDKNSVD